MALSEQIEQTITAFQHRLPAILATLTDDMELIRDAVQQAAVEALQIGERVFELPPEDITDFMRRAAVDMVYAEQSRSSQSRSSGRRVFKDSGFLAAQFGEDAGSNPETLCRLEEALQGLDKIDPIYRFIFDLAAADHSAEEIAEATLMPLDLIKERFSMIKQALQAMNAPLQTPAAGPAPQA